MSDRVYNILFLCTGNSARSIMAEALVTQLGNGRFKAYSAGSKPGGTVNPFAIELVRQIGYPVENLRSKSWDECAAPDAPHMDFIITVCDNAAGEECPFWPGKPNTAHWGFADPAAVEGSDDDKRREFQNIFIQITNRVRAFTSLPLAALDANAIQREMVAIGERDSNAVAPE